jgi:signal transduction histidine kinase
VDRVDALSGRLTLKSRLGGGTQLRAEIPMKAIRASDGG